MSLATLVFNFHGGLPWGGDHRLLTQSNMVEHIAFVDTPQNVAPIKLRSKNHVDNMVGGKRYLTCSHW